MRTLSLVRKIGNERLAHCVFVWLYAKHRVGYVERTGVTALRVANL
jgi:hypothetical protein